MTKTEMSLKLVKTILCLKILNIPKEENYINYINRRNCSNEEDITCLKPEDYDTRF